MLPDPGLKVRICPLINLWDLNDGFDKILEEPDQKGQCFFKRTNMKYRVSEPACLGMAPAPGIFNPEPAPAPGKREQKFGFF